MCEPSQPRLSDFVSKLSRLCETLLDTPNRNLTIFNSATCLSKLRKIHPPGLRLKWYKFNLRSLEKSHRNLSLIKIKMKMLKESLMSSCAQQFTEQLISSHFGYMNIKSRLNVYINGLHQSIAVFTQQSKFVQTLTRHISMAETCHRSTFEGKCVKI